jgi:hypothetical protein
MKSHNLTASLFPVENNGIHDPATFISKNDNMLIPLFMSKIFAAVTDKLSLPSIL